MAKTLYDLFQSKDYLNGSNETKQGLFHAWKIVDFPQLTQGYPEEQQSEFLDQAQDAFSEHGGIKRNNQRFTDLGLGVASSVPTATNTVAETVQQVGRGISSAGDALQREIADLLPEGSIRDFLIEDANRASQKQAEFHQGFDEKIQGGLSDAAQYFKDRKSDYAKDRDVRRKEIQSLAEGQGFTKEMLAELSFYGENPGSILQDFSESLASMVASGAAVTVVAKGRPLMEGLLAAMTVEAAMGGGEAGVQVTEQIVRDLEKIVGKDEAHRIASAASRDAFVTAAALSGAVGAVGIGGATAKVVSSKAQKEALSKLDKALQYNALTKTGAGAAMFTANVFGEGAQGAAVEIASNAALIEAGYEKELTEGVAAAAVQEAVAGSPGIAAVQAAGAIRRDDTPAPQQTPQGKKVDIQGGKATTVEEVEVETPTPHVQEPAKTAAEAPAEVEIEQQARPVEQVVKIADTVLAETNDRSSDFVSLEESYNDSSVDELKDTLKEQKLPATGRKSKLVEKASAADKLSAYLSDSTNEVFIAESGQELATMLDENKAYRDAIMTEVKKIYPPSVVKKLDKGNGLDLVEKLTPFIDANFTLEDSNILDIPDVKAQDIPSSDVDVIVDDALGILNLEATEVVENDEGRADSTNSSLLGERQATTGSPVEEVVQTGLGENTGRGEEVAGDLQRQAIGTDSSPSAAQQATGQAQPVVDPATGLGAADRGRGQDSQSVRRADGEVAKQRRSANQPRGVGSAAAINFDSRSPLNYADMPPQFRQQWNQSDQTQQDADAITREYFLEDGFKRLSSVQKAFGVTKADMLNAMNRTDC